MKGYENRQHYHELSIKELMKLTHVQPYFLIEHVHFFWGESLRKSNIYADPLNLLDLKIIKTSLRIKTIKHLPKIIGNPFQS